MTVAVLTRTRVYSESYIAKHRPTYSAVNVLDTSTRAQTHNTQPTLFPKKNLSTITR